MIDISLAIDSIISNKYFFDSIGHYAASQVQYILDGSTTGEIFGVKRGDTSYKLRLCHDMNGKSAKERADMFENIYAHIPDVLPRYIGRDENCICCERIDPAVLFEASKKEDKYFILGNVLRDVNDIKKDSNILKIKENTLDDVKKASECQIFDQEQYKKIKNTVIRLFENRYLQVGYDFCDAYYTNIIFDTSGKLYIIDEDAIEDNRLLGSGIAKLITDKNIHIKDFFEGYQLPFNKESFILMIIIWMLNRIFRKVDIKDREKILYLAGYEQYKDSFVGTSFQKFMDYFSR